MDAFLTTVNAVLPAFLLIAAGMWAGKRFPDLKMETLTQLTVYLLLPALVFRALATTQLTLSVAVLIAAAYLLYLVALGLFTYLASGGLDGKARRALVVTSLFGNTGNMGLPITLFAYGEAGLERGVVVFILSLAAMFALGPTLLKRGGGFVSRLGTALRLPPLWAALLGLAFNLWALPLPLSVARGVSLLADAAIPVMLLSLGVQVYRSWVWELDATALRASLFRLGFGPLVAYGAGLALGLEALELRVLVLMAAMPSAVTMFVVAVEVGGDYEGIARTVVATTVGSLAAILAVIVLLPP